MASSGQVTLEFCGTVCSDSTYGRGKEVGKFLVASRATCFDSGDSKLSSLRLGM